MRRLLPLLALLAALAHPRPARAQAADSVFLRPGDLIHLVVYRQADFTGDFGISPEGTIQHPLLADVNVVGVPRSVIRDRLRAALARFDRDPAFVFDFLYRVSVGGEVRVPNLLNLPPQTTLVQAIAAAGGATEFGRLDRVVLVRDGQQQVVDLQRADPNTSTMRVHSGDQIRVPRRGNAVRDVLAPAGSIVAAIAAVITVVRLK